MKVVIRADPYNVMCDFAKGICYWIIFVELVRIVCLTV